MIQKHLLPSLGQVPLRKLEERHMDALQQALIQKELSETTIHNIFRLLNIILKKARNEGVLASNPCEKMRVPNKNEKRRSGFSSEERKRLIQALCSENEQQQLEVLLPLYTGLRVGELCALRLGDIDVEQEILRVRKTLQRVDCFEGGKKGTALVLSSPKSKKSIRDIPLPPPLVKLLLQRKAAGQPEDFLLGKRAKPMEPRNVQRHFHRL